MERRYLSVKEVSQYLGFSVNTLYGWTSQRRIPFLKIGGRVRFDKAELDRWMQEGSRDVVAEKEQP